MLIQTSLKLKTVQTVCQNNLNTSTFVEQLTQHRFAKQFWVCANNFSLNPSINPKAAWQARTRGSAGQGSREETRTSTLLTQRNKEVSQVKPNLLHRVNSSTLARHAQPNLTTLILYIYICQTFLTYIYTYTYYIRKRTQFENTQKQKTRHVWTVSNYSCQQNENPFFFQAGKGIAFDMRRSCPTPTTPLRQYRGHTEVSPLWTPKMHSSWNQVVKRHLQDWTLTELGHTSLLFGLPHLRMRTDAQSACYQAGENKI